MAGPYALVSKRLNREPGTPASMSSAVIAGSSAGVCYWSIVYPLAVVKVAPHRHAGATFHTCLLMTVASSILSLARACR